MYIDLTNENIELYSNKHKQVLYNNLKISNEEFKKQFNIDYSLFMSKDELKLHEEEEENSILQTVEDAFNISKCKKHKFVLPNYDFVLEKFPIFKAITNENRESLCIIELNNEQVIDIHKFVGTECSVGISIQDIFKYLIKKGINKYAIVHNHPNSIVANFTEDDIKNNYILGFYSNTFGLEFIDSFVITPFDCESQYQSDIENKENNLNPKQFKDLSKYKQINPKLYPILLHGLKTK